MSLGPLYLTYLTQYANDYYRLLRLTTTMTTTMTTTDSYDLVQLTFPTLSTHVTSHTQNPADESGPTLPDMLHSGGSAPVGRGRARATYAHHLSSSR